MSKTTCRYCPFYCPSRTTPIYGTCTAASPPISVNLRNMSFICPFSWDANKISALAEHKGINNHLIMCIQYYAVSEYGIRTRLYSNLPDLMEYLSSQDLHFSVYMNYVDHDRRVYNTTCVMKYKGGQPVPAQ